MSHDLLNDWLIDTLVADKFTSIGKENIFTIKKRINCKPQNYIFAVTDKGIHLFTIGDRNWEHFKYLHIQCT